MIVSIRPEYHRKEDKLKLTLQATPLNFEEWGYYCVVAQFFVDE
jgi:hypothetical protein